MTKISWLFNRLKAMSVGELFYRIKKEFIKQYNKFKYRKNIEVKDNLKKNIDLKSIDLKLNQIFGDILNINIDTYKNKYYCFGREIDILNKIEWHKGINGIWNKEKYSLDIDTKYSDSIGDIRYNWEINRHHFFPYLALKYRDSNDKSYYELLKRHFYEWNRENYFLKGINWLSSMEIAIRSYQWLITYYILEEIAENDFREDLMKSIISSMEYVSRNLSKYSSANNHLILEATIMSIIGYVIKDVHNQNWFKIGYDILQKEIGLQFYSDGINKEHALHYQAFVTDAILQYNFILNKIGMAPIHESLIKKSLEFMGSIEADKTYIDFGDSDDAKIISFGCNKINYYKSVLELGSIYYKIKFTDFTNISLENIFISGVDEIEEYPTFKYEEYKLYKDGGYLVVKSNENLILMDVAELGFGSIAAHGHADALSIIYYNKNNPIFIDSGTYIYNIESEYRNYFRGTSAHNTLSYNNRNQSEIKGPFLWGRKAKVNINKYEVNDEGLIIEACHNGYEPLVHKRKVKYIENEQKIIIRDFFEENATINYILDSSAEIKRIDYKNVEIKSNESIILVSSNKTIDIEDSLISKSFMEKEMSKKLVIKADFSKEKYIETIVIEKN